MTDQEKQAIINDLATKVQDASKSELETIKADLNGLDVNALKALQEKDLADSETVENLKSSIDEMREKMRGIEDAQGGKPSKKTLEQEVKEKKEDLKSLVKDHSGKTVEIKAVTNRASIANNGHSVELPDIGQLGVKRRALYDYFSKFPVGDGNHNGTIEYVDWDEDTTSRAAAAIDEGTQFPESTAKFQNYSTKLKKIGDSLPVTEEFGDDEVLAAAELDNFVRVNVNTKIDEQIANGTGAGNIQGLNTVVPAYTAPTAGIADANIKDLVRKMRTAIVKNRGSKYQPNLVAANSDVIDQYMLKKDANNNYMFDSDTGQIAGLDIVEDNNLPDNTLVVGDGRFGRIYEKSGVELSRGLVNEQFTGDLETIKGRARLLFLIREVDKTGFLKSTDIGADLTTLATS